MSVDWAEPGPKPVAHGVHRIPLPLPNDGLRAVNVYAIADGDRVALIDTGCPHDDARHALGAGLASIGYRLADVSKVIATHAHYDHFGLASAIRAESGAEVLIGAREVALLDVALSPDSWRRWREHRREWLGRHDAAGVLATVEQLEANEQWAALHGAGRWEAPDTRVPEDGTVALSDRSLRAIWTPGHTRGHLVYVDDAAGLLFAGDHVLPHITPSLGFEPFSDGRALELFLKSLAHVRELDVTRVLPGHGPVFDDLAGRVDELVAHHDRRLAACVDAVSANGGGSAFLVASQLLWTSRDRAFSDLDPFNRMLAVTETVTHLEWLVANGRLERRDGPDVHVRYTRAPEL